MWSNDREREIVVLGVLEVLIYSWRIFLGFSIRFVSKYIFGMNY